MITDAKGGLTANLQEIVLPVTIPEMFFSDEREIWLETRTRFLSKAEAKMIRDQDKKKYAQLDRQDNRFNRLARSYWSAVLVATVQEAAQVAEEISKDSSGSSPILALLFCGSNLFNFGVPFESDVDLRLLAGGEPWDAINDFNRVYKERFGNLDKTEWYRNFRFNFFPPFPGSNLSPAPERKDLVLPSSYFDLGWNQEGGAIGPITSEAGFFNTEVVELVLADPVKQIERKIASTNGLNHFSGATHWLGLHELAFSRPVFAQKGKEDYVQSLISRAKRVYLSSG